jgi:hypothetical protein
MTGGHMGSKGLVAALLWSERYQMGLNIVIQYTEIVIRTQFLHQQCFAAHMPAWLLIKWNFPGLIIKIFPAPTMRQSLIPFSVTQ